MGARIQDLTAATTITEASDLVELSQPSQTAPTSRKATLAQVLAGVRGAITTAIGTALLRANDLSDVTSASSARSNLGLGSAATHAAADFDAAGAAAAVLTTSAQLAATSQTFTGLNKFLQNLGLSVDVTTGSGTLRALGDGMAAIYRVTGADIFFLGGLLSTSAPFVAQVENPGSVNVWFSNMPADSHVQEAGGAAYVKSHTYDWASNAKHLTLVWDGTQFSVIEFGKYRADHDPVQTVSTGTVELDFTTPAMIRVTGDCRFLVGGPDVNFSSGAGMRWRITNTSAASITVSGTFDYVVANAKTHVTTTQVFTNTVLDVIWDGTNTIVLVF
jgi:hypothetical protein